MPCELFISKIHPVADPGAPINMLARGLKAKMGMNIVILLVMAMISIDLVIIVTIQKDLIRAEISKGEMVLARLEEHALAAALWDNIGSHSESKASGRARPPCT